MAVGEICNREVVIAKKTLSVVDAAQLMRKHHVGDLVVVEEKNGRRHPVGIVTDRDIVVEVVAAGVNPDALKVGDIMGPEVATVRESEGLFEALRYMRDKGVRVVFLMHNAAGIQYPAAALSYTHILRHLAAQSDAELQDLGTAAARKSPIETFIEKRDAARRQSRIPHEE